MFSGKLINEWYWENGCLQKQEFSLDDGISVEKNYFDDGSLWRLTTFNKDGLRHGLHCLYFTNGKIKLEEEYENGYLIYQKTYNQSGMLLVQDKYENRRLKRRAITMVAIIDF